MGGSSVSSIAQPSIITARALGTKLFPWISTMLLQMVRQGAKALGVTASPHMVVASIVEALTLQVSVVCPSRIEAGLVQKTR
jgi:hypothetical protein